MEVTRIDQMAIAVPDLDEALAFYERVFGLTPSHRARAEVDGVDEAMLEVAGVSIQLIAPIGEDSSVTRFLERRGPGLHHLGIAVRSIDEALDHLREQGVRLIDEQPRTGTSGHRIAFVHPQGTGGVLIELVEDGGDDAVAASLA